MHKIYKDKGIFNISYQIPQIFYSSMISAFISTIIKHFALSQQNVINLKDKIKANKKQDYSKNIFGELNIKFFAFFVCSFLFLIFFWVL